MNVMQEENTFENSEQNDIYDNQEPENDIYENVSPAGENHYEIVDGFNPNENITAKKIQKRKIMITFLAGILVVVAVLSSTLSIKLQKSVKFDNNTTKTEPFIQKTYLESITTLQPKLIDSTVPTTTTAGIKDLDLEDDDTTAVNRIKWEFFVEFFLLYNTNNRSILNS